MKIHFTFLLIKFKIILYYKMKKNPSTFQLFVMSPKTILKVSKHICVKCRMILKLFRVRTKPSKTDMKKVMIGLACITNVGCFPTRKMIFFFHHDSFLSSLPSPFFLGLEHHNGVNISVWPDLVFVKSCLQGLFLQVWMLCLFAQREIDTVCLQ